MIICNYSNYIGIVWKVCEKIGIKLGYSNEDTEETKFTGLPQYYKFVKLKENNIEYIEKTIKQRVESVGEKVDDNFIFGEYIAKPNARGVFSEKDNWFIYEIDERMVNSISGPFSLNEIIFAISLQMHISNYFDDYKFGEDGYKKYIHNHFRSLNEALEQI